MSKIKWLGIIKGNLADYQMGDLPDNAVKLQTPDSVSLMQLKALPFAIPSVVALAIALGIKSYIAKELILSPLFIVVGVALGLILLVLHELLHAAVYPKNATVYVGFYSKGLSAVALASYPLKKARFICMCLLPYVLGMVPLVALCIMPINFKITNAVLFGTAVIGLISPYPDAYNCYLAIRQTPRNCYIQFYGDNMYYIEN